MPNSRKSGLSALGLRRRKTLLARLAGATPWVVLALVTAVFARPASAAPPTAPGPTTVSCAYAVSDDCWVTGDFGVSVSPATGGVAPLVYHICRSVDSPGGFAGCDVNLTLSGGTSYTVSGTATPSDGYRRAYYFLAKDATGVTGAWNSPRYVRVDRYDPVVSATNASDTWFTSRTATLSAADATVSAAANSGLVAFRYSWNTPPNAACTTGTATSSGATLTAPAGENWLYLCGKDNTGRVGTWSGRYRVSAPLSAPGPTTVSCAYSISDDCWVTGDFGVSVAPATGGVAPLVYHICRSVDSPGGFAGCDVNLTLSGGSSYTVSGTSTPSDGYRRAYYFLAKDSTGTTGPWNSPRYVRVDRYNPVVSATNASGQWFSSRTATLSAADATVSAAANSGLVAFRYSWNSPLDGSCTTGTATSSGATLTAPNGDNMLYLCGRDNTGRVGSWSGQYRVSAPPTAPGPTTVACAYSNSDNCWVTGDFVVSVTAATGGVAPLTYEICRSVDSAGGFAGCDASITLNGSTSHTITGVHVPSDGFRRAYYFLARDSVGVLGPWNSPRYVRVDRYAPAVSASNASDSWFASRTATISAADATVSAAANSGLFAVRYSWNTALDAACTTGTATSSGATLTAPTGDNMLYLCGRDNTGRVGQWSGRYRVSAAPSAPGPTTVACAYSFSDDCWVTSDFTISVAAATGGVAPLTYEICRSVDSPGGFAGCDFSLTLNGSTSYAVSGTNTPSDGFRRAYYFLARDSIGVLGPWNSPRYVRVDRYAPVVSATNASDQWFSSRTATISASDTTVSAAANSGVALIRYSWNSALDAACATGTVTSSGATLTAPTGDNTLYLCARDNTGRVGQWNGRYRVGALPSAPGPTTVACAYSVSDDCWVTGDFTVSVTPATGGVAPLVYEICRSVDSPGGFAGCDFGLTLNGTTSYAVAGTNTPSDGFRRAYYFLARDSVGAQGPWNSPRYVRVDRYAPVASATNASDEWFPSRNATVSAVDTTVSAAANSGLGSIRYSWNTALDAACTTGTVTTSGATLTAPSGDNTLYLCAKDNTGRVGQWNGRYRVGAVPTAPGPTTVVCAYSVGDDCWVTTDFGISVTAATGGTGSLAYQVCRSLDSPGGFAGCDVNLTLDGLTWYAVTGAHTPSDGFRRAYYFRARDSVGAYGAWNTPRYVRMDRYNPVVSATNASDQWFPSRTATLSASDTTVSAAANSGLVDFRYSWNTALDPGCTTGTVAMSGSTLTAPSGDNVLYLCGRDATGRVGQWNGRYRVGVPPGFTLSASPAQRNLFPGENVGYTVTVTPGTGFTDTVTFSATGLPNASSASWTPVSVTASGSTALRIFTSGSTTPGLYTLTLTGTANSVSQSVTVTLNVRTASDFSVEVNPSLASTGPGGSASYEVMISSASQVAGGVNLSASGLPAGFTASFDPANVAVGVASTMTVVTPANAAANIYDFTVQGVGGGLTRTTGAQIRVGNTQKPVLTRITPDSIGNGGLTRVTVQGSLLGGSTVSIAEEQPDPDDPVFRTFPTASLVSINPAGTSMVVDIDATSAQILDFYNLVVDNGAGIEAIPFRVLPGGPLVDAWTPSEPEVGLIHALSIAGRNLAGTSITPSVGGRIALHSVETSDTEITALLEVLPNAHTGPMDLIVSDSIGRTARVRITIVPDGGSSLEKHNLTESKDGEKVDYTTSRRPAVWFQEFTIRDPEKTEVTEEGLDIQGIDKEAYLAKRASKSISWELYIKITIPLVRVQWQKVILFDPITGALGDAVLQALGVGSQVPISAFVISAYFQMDLTIYFRLTGTGFTFPRFCIEITYGIEITGFDGFAYSQSFCVGGGWHAFGTGSVSTGEITGGECATVTSTLAPDGIVDAEVEQNACCAQPIGVAMSGHTFSGLSFGRSFSVNNPQAGSTSTNQAVCACPCTVTMPTNMVMRPGNTANATLMIKNQSSADCTYTYTLRKSNGQLNVNLINPTGNVTVPANQQMGIVPQVEFPTGRPAPDEADLVAELTHTDGSNSHLACQAASFVCVIPDNEHSDYFQWDPAPLTDRALFKGIVEPSATRFDGRQVYEEDALQTVDTCYYANSPIPSLVTLGAITGGDWTITSGNDYSYDTIGWGRNIDGEYTALGRTPCTMSAVQKMKMNCKSQVAEYTRHGILMDLQPNGTKITRDGETTPNAH